MNLRELQDNRITTGYAMKRKYFKDRMSRHDVKRVASYQNAYVSNAITSYDIIEKLNRWSHPSYGSYSETLLHEFYMLVGNGEFSKEYIIFCRECLPYVIRAFEYCSSKLARNATIMDPLFFYISRRNVVVRSEFMKIPGVQSLSRIFRDRLHLDLYDTLQKNGNGMRNLYRTYEWKILVIGSNDR